jgi:hypothetical protein
MVRNIRVIYIVLILLFPVLFFTACMSPCRGGIRHGTVVIVSMDPDSIILAADSRETDIDFTHKKVTFGDTAHKIFRIRSTFFAIAGLSELSNMSIKTFINDVYDTTISIKANMPVIETRLKDALQKELDAYSTRQKRLLGGHDYSVDLFIAGYEKGVPQVCRINAGVKFVKLSANPVEVTDDADNGPMFDIAGISDHISQVPLNLKSNKLHTMSAMISLEASHHNDVDSLVQYAIIKKDGYRTGRKVGSRFVN